MEFPKKFKRTVEVTWDTFVAVVQGFVGNHKPENYVSLVNYTQYRMSIIKIKGEYGSTFGGARRVLSPGYTGL